MEMEIKPAHGRTMAHCPGTRCRPAKTATFGRKAYVRHKRIYGIPSHQGFDDVESMNRSSRTQTMIVAEVCGI